MGCGRTCGGAVTSMPEQLFDPRTLLVTAPVFLFSLSLHEFMHAWTANRLGDPTARLAGRLTVNPIAHYDLFGTTLGLLVRVFGWAKPVPVNEAAFRRPKRDMMLTALGGPATNLALALCFGVVFKVVQAFDPATLGRAPGLAELVEKMAGYGVYLNLALAVFNLIPLHPLDGHHILRGFLSFRGALAYDRMKRFSSYLLMFLILFSFLGLGPPILSIVIFRPMFFIMRLGFTTPEYNRLVDVVGPLLRI